MKAKKNQEKEYPKELLSTSMQELIGGMCDEYHPKFELTKIVIDFKNKRIYSTDTRRLIIFYMDSFSDVEEKFFIDKRVFLNEDFKIKQNAVLIGTNEFKPYNCEQNFQYPDINKIIPQNFEHIYEVTNFEINTFHFLLNKHNFFYETNYVNALKSVLSVKTDNSKCYLKINSTNEPILITLEDSGKEIFKYLIMPIAIFDGEKNFKKISQRGNLKSK